VKKLRLDQRLSVVLLLAACFLAGGVAPSSLAAQKQTTPLPQPLISYPNPPEVITTINIPLYTSIGESQIGSEMASLSATAVYVMDRDSGAILYQKNASVARYPASTAKMMTALVARQVYPLDKKLKVNQEAFATGSTVGFKVGEELIVRDLLSALLIYSGNDAAIILADNHLLGYDGFVQSMNDKAKELHLDHTIFHNPSGLDKNDQESTARDLAILANELMKDSVLREIVGTKELRITDVSGSSVHQLFNRNLLLGTVPGVVGIKTGTTEGAGENLVTEVDRDDHQVIIVVLGSKDRYQETKNVINWTFRHYDWKKIDHQSKL
jgi:D-alanyl-D-alanine carboxypeptidase (penicillin-binding protein 5/6)